MYETIILHVVLYGCETLSVTLRKEHRLTALEKRVLRKIFGPKKVEIRNYITRSVITVIFASIIRMINSRRTRLAGHVARMG
jgi:hypothetical protein